MQTLIIPLAAALFFAGAALAQTPPSDSSKGEHRAKMHDAMKKARAACDAKKGDERRDCMRQQMCAQAKDPAACEARAKERMAMREKRMEMRQKAHEACSGKRGEELKSCLKEQMGKHRGNK